MPLNSINRPFQPPQVVLGRNAINYYRNPGNVLARVTVMLVIAGLEVRCRSTLVSSSLLSIACMHLQ